MLFSIKAAFDDFLDPSRFIGVAEVGRGRAADVYLVADAFDDFLS